jgi:hypothetical protein
MSQHPYKYHRWRHCKFQALRAISYKRTYESQNFFFWFTSDAVLQETHLSISRLLREFLWGGLQAKVVPETDYLSRFFRSPARVPLASPQADSALTCRQSRSLRIPEEQDDCKNREVEQSAPTHAHHTHCTPMHLGTTANRSVAFLGTDFKKCAIWQGSGEKPAAKDFIARKVRTIDWNKV